MDELLKFEREYEQSNPDAGVTVKEMATSGDTVFSRGVMEDGSMHLLCAHVDEEKISEVWVLTE